jgi:hypothetical protein
MAVVGSGGSPDAARGEEFPSADAGVVRLGRAAEYDSATGKNGREIAAALRESRVHARGFTVLPRYRCQSIRAPWP